MTANLVNEKPLRKESARKGFSSKYSAGQAMDNLTI